MTQCQICGKEADAGQQYCWDCGIIMDEPMGKPVMSPLPVVFTAGIGIGICIGALIASFL